MDMKSPVAVVQEYDRKKKLAGDLGNGFVRFNLSPAKVRKPLWLLFNSISTYRYSSQRKEGFRFVLSVRRSVTHFSSYCVCRAGAVGWSIHSR